MAAATIAAVNAQKAAQLKVHRPKTGLSILKQHRFCRQKASHRLVLLTNRAKSSASRASVAAAIVTAGTAANAVKVGSVLNAPMVASSRSQTRPLHKVLKQHPRQYTKNARSHSLKRQQLLYRPHQRPQRHQWHAHPNLPELRPRRCQRFSPTPCPCRTWFRSQRLQACNGSTLMLQKLQKRRQRLQQNPSPSTCRENVYLS